ncbi:MAG: DegT/DnrJ/EryC1/StrS family aminotransferase [Dehalococcoidia bacterium]
MAKIYSKELAGIDGLVLPITHHPSPRPHVYHQYTIRVLDNKRACPERSRRDELQKYLKDKGISTMVYYPVPLHKMKVFDKRCRMPAALAEAERAVQEVLSLPIEPLMTEDEISYVCETIITGNIKSNKL